MTPPTHIAIVGMMGSGKSTLAAAVSDRVGLPVVDSDAEILAQSGMTSGEYGARFGVPALHEFEAEVASRALRAASPVVVTPAASVVERSDIRRLLAERAFVVWIDLPLPTLIASIDGASHRRKTETGEMSALLDRRRSSFASVCDLRLDRRDDPGLMAGVVVIAFDQSSKSS